MSPNRPAGPANEPGEFAQPPEPPAMAGTSAPAITREFRQLQEEFTSDLEILRYIGDESFGSLYLARELTPPRLVVVKVLRREFIGNTEARLRFQRATRAIGRITHPNVVPIFRVGTLRNGIPYSWEQHVGESTLRDRKKAVGRFAASEVRSILRQLSSALEATHRRGIVHRDVRPETIRCEDETDRVLLTDFGLSGILETATFEELSITKTNELIGSPDYVSPEQREGKRVTDRSDVYQLGVLGWRLLVDEAAVPANGRLDRARLPETALEDSDLLDLISRCLRERPSERPSARDLVIELDRGKDRGRSGSWWPGWPTILRERRIPHFVVPYLVAAFSVFGAVATLVEMGLLPQWFFLEVLIFLIAGLFAVVVIAWNHGATGRQETTWPERMLLAGIAVAWIAASVIVWIRFVGQY